VPHQAALQLTRGGDDGFRGLLGTLDGAQDVGDAALLWEGWQRHIELLKRRPRSPWMVDASCCCYSVLDEPSGMEYVD